MSYEQQVWNAWWAGVFFVVVAVTLAVLTHRAEDHGPTVFARLLIMLRVRRAARPAISMEPVYIPVSRYGMDTAGMDEDEADAPDMDAPNAGIPHFKRDITDGEWIAYMAVARTKDGKPRFSANQIHAAVGGDRNAVLARVKELRAAPSPAQYRQPDGSTDDASSARAIAIRNRADGERLVPLN